MAMQSSGILRWTHLESAPGDWRGRISGKHTPEAIAGFRRPAASVLDAANISFHIGLDEGQ
jgi:hypothetical protein